MGGGELILWPGKLMIADLTPPTTVRRVTSNLVMTKMTDLIDVTLAVF